MDIAGFISSCLETRKEVEEVVKQLYHLQKFEMEIKSDKRVVDLIRHLLWYEEQMLHVLQERNLGDHPYWNLDHAQRNQLIKENFLDYGDDMIFGRFMKIGKELAELMQSIPIKEYLDPTAFDMPPDWKPHDILNQNLLEHYQSHLEQLRKCIH